MDYSKFKSKWTHIARAIILMNTRRWNEGQLPYRIQHGFFPFLPKLCQHHICLGCFLLIKDFSRNISRQSTSKFQIKQNKLRISLKALVLLLFISVSFKWPHFQTIVKEKFCVFIFASSPLRCDWPRFPFGIIAFIDRQINERTNEYK